MMIRFRAVLAPFAAAAALASTAFADRWDDALALVPADALSALVVPNPKQASDDLQQALERMGRAEVALGGRPIDMLRARFGIGAGFDDKGMLAAWTLPGEGGTNLCIMVPVTDAAAFMRSSLEPTDPARAKREADSEAASNGAGSGAATPPNVTPAQGAPTYRFTAGGPVMYARTVGSHVLLSTDAKVAERYETKPGFAASLGARIGARGQQVARSGDLLVWAGHGTFTGYAADMKAAAEAAAAAVAAGADADIPPEVRAIIGDSAQLQAQMEQGAAMAEQVGDALLTVDFDALGIGLRSFVRLEPGSELAKAIPASAAADSGAASANGAASAAAAPGALLNGVPNAPFYMAGGLNIKAMGGLANMRTMLAALPMGDQIPMPAWLDTVQGKIDAVQVALYPSKLSVLAGGLGNDAAFFVRTSDAEAVKRAFRDWVQAQAGERNGVTAEASWEENRELRDGSKADAFAVKETVVDLNAAGGTTARLTKQLMVGSRGLHGFAVTVPDGLVITMSQRPDVIERAVKAATKATPALGQQGAIGSYTPWLMNEPDAVVFIGLGELLAAVQQVASAMPGGAADVLPMPTGPVEPIAGAVRGRDGSWEAALVVPSTALAVGFDVALAQMMGGQGMMGAEEEEGTRSPQGATPTPAPSGAPAPAPAPAPGSSP